MATHVSERVRFGGLELDLRTGELVANEPGVDGAPPQKLLLREQPFQILRILIEHEGEIVTRDEIKKVLWPDDTNVDFDRSINVAMAILRKAVGDTAENPKYIETLPRRGYRLKVPVEREETTGSPKVEDLQTSAAAMHEELLPVQKTRPWIHLARRWMALTAATAVLLIVAGTLYWHFHNKITLSSSDTLVLADVTNQTADSALDDGLSYALQIALQQTPYLNLLGDDKVHETLRLLRLHEDTRITPDIALQVCRKTNSRAVISAFVRDAGNRFRVGLSAIDCQSGKTLKQVVHEAGAREDVVRTLGSSASQLRLKLGESTDSIRRFNQPLDQATSYSPDALQFLVLGYKKHLSGDISGAFAYYSRAIDKDPNFALAYAAQASANNWLHQPEQALVASSKAFELRNRLTVPSRFQMETVYYGARQERDKECSVARQWVQAFPRDVFARTNLASVLGALGQHDEGLGQAREAARLFPGAATLINLMGTAIFAQRFDEAREAYDDVISRQLDSPRLHLLHAQLAFLQNDKSGMQKEWDWAAQDPVQGRFVLFRESRAEDFHGRSRNAHRLLQRNVDTSMKAGFPADAAGFEGLEALSDAEIGKLRQSQALITDALHKSQDRIVLTLAAFTFARAGDIKQSQKLMQRLNQLFPDDLTIHTFILPTTQAAIKLHENDPAGAIEILRPVTPYDLAITDGFYYVYPAYLRGVAYLQLGQGDLAAAQFQKVLDHSGVGAGFVTSALSMLQLARAQVVMHDERAAQKSYEDFLSLWKDADADLPIYKEAKAEYAALRKTIGFGSVAD